MECHFCLRWLLNFSSGECMPSEKQLGQLDDGEHPLQLVMSYLDIFSTLSTPWLCWTTILIKIDIGNQMLACAGATETLVSSTHTFLSNREKADVPTDTFFPCVHFVSPGPRYKFVFGMPTVLQHKEGCCLPRMMTTLYLMALTFAFEMSPRL